MDQEDRQDRLGHGQRVAGRCAWWPAAPVGKGWGVNVRWWHRGGVGVGVVGLVAGALVVTSGAAGAVDPAPSPVSVPSSVVGSVTGATPGQRAAMFGAVGLLGVPVAAGTEVGAVTAAGAVGGVSTAGAGAVVGGLFIGFEGGSQVLRWAGVPDDMTGIDGLTSLWTATGPQAGFDPNVDVAIFPAGWFNGVNVYQSVWTRLPGWTTWNATGVYVTVTGPITGEPGTITMDFAPTAAPGGDASGKANYVGYFTHVVIDAGSCGSASGGGGYKLVDASGHFYITASVLGGSCVWHLEVKDNTNPTPLLNWYPVGHSQRPADTDPNPSRAWETRWTCSGGATGVLRSSTFREGDTQFPLFPSPTCAAGTVVTGYTIWQVSVGGGPAETQVSSWTPKQPLIDWQTNYPQCSNGSCKLELFRVDPTTQGQISCFATPEACLNWATDPALSGQMQCMYAGAPVALSECNAYVPTFNVMTGTRVQTSTGIKESTDVRTFADPATGEPQPNPNPDPVPAPQPGPDGSAPDGCPPPFSFTLGGIGYWVTKGAECALAWAFVPPGGLVQDEVGTTTDVLSARPPWSLVAPIGAMFTGMTSGWSTGCSEMADFDPSHHHLSLPCNPPASDSMTVLRWFITVALVVGTGFAVWHMLVAAIGARQAD